MGFWILLFVLQIFEKSRKNISLLIKKIKALGV